LKVLAVAVDPDLTDPAQSAPGTVFKHQREVYVVTGQGVIRLVTVQPAGKKAMTAGAMLNGQPELVGSRLGGG
jgi:methionyl-tRNA formyltransferase